MLSGLTWEPLSSRDKVRKSEVALTATSRPGRAGPGQAYNRHNPAGFSVLQGREVPPRELGLSNIYIIYENMVFYCENCPDFHLFALQGVRALPFTAEVRTETSRFHWIWQKGIQHSQLGVHLSSTLRQLVGVEVKGDVTLQAEEVAAVALLEDRLGFQFRRLAEKHQQVPEQKPGGTGHRCLWTTWFFPSPKKIS